MGQKTICVYDYMLINEAGKRGRKMYKSSWIVGGERLKIPPLLNSSPFVCGEEEEKNEVES